MSDASPHLRFWWLKRLALGWAVVLALWGGAHALLWWSADARLAAHVERWRGDGGPLPEQVVVVGHPAQTPDNAAALIVRATGQLARPNQPQSDHWDNATLAFPLAGLQLDTMRGLARQDQPAVLTLRQSRALPSRDWGIRAVRIETMLPRLNEFRNLANRIRCAGQVSHHDGDLAEALRLADDLIYLSDSTGDDGPALVTSLVALGVQSVGTTLLTTDIIGRPVPTLSPDAERGAWRAAAPQARALIARLLEESSLERTLRLGVQGERTTVYCIRDVVNGWTLSDVNPYTAPFVLAQLDALLVEHAAGAEAILATGPIDRAAVARMPTWAPAGIQWTGAAELMTSAISDMLGHDWHRPAFAFRRARAERRAAAVLLALKLYEAEQGRFPPSLVALVPNYLPAVPADPFARNAVPFGYRPEGPVPLIYSVGPDGIDGGGDWTTDPAAPLRQAPWWSKDAPFVLRQPPDSALPLYQWLAPDLYRDVQPRSASGPASE